MNSLGIDESGSTANRYARGFCCKQCRQRKMACQVGCGRSHVALRYAIFRKRPFSRALLSIRRPRFVDVSIGITPRNVRSEGVAPCKW